MASCRRTWLRCRRRSPTCKLKLKPLADVKKALAEAIDKLQIEDDVEGHVEKGAKFEAEIGPRGRKREVKDMKLVETALGAKLFRQLAKVNLKDLDAYLTPPQLDEVLDTKRTDHSIKVTKRV